MSDPLSHDALGERYAVGLRSKGKLALANYSLMYVDEKPDVIIWQGGCCFHTVEVKISRSDFRRDAHKPWRDTPERFYEAERKRLHKAETHWRKRVADERRRFDEHWTWLQKQREERNLPELNADAEWARREREQRYAFCYYHRLRKQGIGSFRSYLCPAGLIQPEEIPEKWGLIWHHNGKVRGEWEVKSRPTRFDDFDVNYHGAVSIMMTALERVAQNVGDINAPIRWNNVGQFVPKVAS